MKKLPIFAALVTAVLTGVAAESTWSHETTPNGNPATAEQIPAHGSGPAPGWYPPPPHPNTGRYAQPWQQQSYWPAPPRGYGQLPPPYPPQGQYQTAPAAPAINPLSAELKYTQEQLTAKSTELGRVHATLEQLRIILQHRLEAEITLNEKVAAITSEQQNLQAQVAELSAELDTATASLEQERQQIATDQKQTHELTAERDQLRDDLANRDKQLATLQAELQTTAQALQQTESETTISRQKLSDATAQAEELKNKRTVLQGQLEDRQTALRDAERSLADVIAERDSLQADLAARSEELAQAQAALTTAESEQSLADVIAERDGLQADLVTRSEELTRAQAALTTAQSEIDALRQAQVETAGVVAVPTTTPATNEEIEVTAVEIAALQTTGLDTDGDGVPDSTDLCSATQQNVTVDGTGCADGVVINLEGVNFRYDSHELTGEAQHILDRIADILTQQPELRLEVAGHTDAQGDPAYNQWLSLKRAEAVRDYIVAQGVNPNHIGAGGYGGQRPVADNSTKEGLRMNRRVELRRLQ